MLPKTSERHTKDVSRISSVGDAWSSAVSLGSLGMTWGAAAMQSNVLLPPLTAFYQLFEAVCPWQMQFSSQPDGALVSGGSPSTAVMCKSPGMGRGTP